MTGLAGRDHNEGVGLFIVQSFMMILFLQQSAFFVLAIFRSEFWAAEKISPIGARPSSYKQVK